MFHKCICRMTAPVVNCPSVRWEQMWAHQPPRIRIDGVEQMRLRQPRSHVPSAVSHLPTWDGAKQMGLLQPQNPQQLLYVTCPNRPA